MLNLFQFFLVSLYFFRKKLPCGLEPPFLAPTGSCKKLAHLNVVNPNHHEPSTIWVVIHPHMISCHRVTQLSQLWLDYPQLSPTIPVVAGLPPTIPLDYPAGLSRWTIPNYPACGWTIPNYPQLSQLWLDYPQLSRWTIPNYPSCGWTIPNYPQLSQFWHWHSSFVPSTSVGGTSTGTACSEQRLGQSGWPWRPDGDETVTLPIRGERGKNTAKLIMIDLWKTVDLSGKYGGTGKKNADLKLRLRFLSINTYDSIIKVGISIRRNIKQRKFRS